jgi:ribulose-phosphate 3-epimerase
MVKCSTSLWSADLANLAAEIRRVEPFTERFHIDVADGHYVHNLLFFPDQVKALRAHTKLPFEVHLMCTDPLSWIDSFIEAGADIIIFCLDSAKDQGEVLRAIKSHGKEAGVSLLITTISMCSASSARRWASKARAWTRAFPAKFARHAVSSIQENSAP